MIPDQQPSLVVRTLQGAALGAGAGVILVALGLVRALFALLTGRHISAPAAADVRTIAFYIGGFALGGAVFGALRPLLRGKKGIYIGCMLVGIIVMLSIAVGDKGSLGALDSFDWIALPILGAILGSAGAYGFTRYD